MGGRGSAGKSRDTSKPTRPEHELPDLDPQPDPTEQVPERPPPVSGAMSDKPLAENGWGYDPTLPVSYHDDGPIGSAVRGMGPDARMDVDGEPLGNVLGRIATDTVHGRRTAQQALDEFKTIRDRLPEGSAAQRRLDWAIRDMDAPASPTPRVPDATPDPLRALVADLHAVPLARRDPSREVEPLLGVIGDVVDGKTSGRRLIRAVQQIGNRRHESLGDSGKFEIDRAVRRAVQALEDSQRADRKPSSGQG